MATNLTANRTLDRDDFQTPTATHAQALFNAGPTQEKHLAQVRANALESTRRQLGSDAADWLKRQFKRIDADFQRGYLAGNAPTANAQTLDYEEWEARDDMAVPETQFRLTAVDDLLDAGFVRNLSLARMVSTWEVRSDAFDAERSMDGRARGDDDNTVVAIDGVPLPITHVDFEISQRKQINSQNFGEDAETSDAREAGRTIREDLEDLIFNGWGNVVETKEGSFSIEGYTSFSDRITGSSSTWTNTPANVLSAVRGMLNDLEQQGANSNEGYMAEELGAWLYVPTAHWGDVTRQPDPEGDGNMSLLQRLEQDFPYVDIRHAGALPSDEAVMVVQDPNVVDLADAQAPTVMSWDVEGGMATRYKSLACRIPRLKSTYNQRSGVVHYTGLN